MRELDEIITRMKSSTSSKTDKDLANYLNLKGNGAISTWRTRNKRPYNECEEISKKEGVSMDWLLFGKEKLQSEVFRESENDVVNIKEYDISLSAGNGSHGDEYSLEIIERPFSKRWLLDKGLSPKNLVLTKVSGDSMEPMLKDKDIVMIDKSQVKPNDAAPFAVRIDDTLYIKRIYRQGHTLKLISINPLYSPLDIDMRKADCEILGVVIWHAHSWV